MQILIAGATGVGKTTLALEISKKHPSYIISTADIREALKTVIDENITPVMFHSTYKLGTVFPQDTIESLLEKQAGPILKATSAILNKHKTDNIIYIAEGVHILPSIFNYFTSTEFVVLLLHQPVKEKHWQWLENRAGINEAKPIAKYEDFFVFIRNLGEYIQNSWIRAELPSSNLHLVYSVREGLEKVSEILPVSSKKE